MTTWQIPESLLETEGQLARRLDAIEAELKAISLKLDTLNLNVLAHLDAIREIEHEQDL